MAARARLRLMAKLRSVTKSASSATWRKPGVEYTRHSQTLCMATSLQDKIKWETVA
jgi:hypothetical protein